MTGKKKTINDISKELGLSKGTISKIINNTDRVSEETRKRVLDYISEVGFVPTFNARKLKQKRSFTIGIVFAEDMNIGLEHHFFATLLNKFKNYVEERGYDISFMVRKHGDVTLSYVDWCKTKQVDGVYIVAGDYNDSGIHELVDSGILCVSNDMFIDGLKTVVSDNEQGIRLTMEYIKNKIKKTKIGMITGPLLSKAFEERKNAFVKIAKELKLEDYGIYHAESFGFTSGYKAILDYKTHLKEMPEVLIVGSDDISFGVLRGLHELDLKVPDDIQVIGFDDIPYASRITPALTTIRQDTTLLGETSAAILIDLMENNGCNIPDITRISTALIVRETTKEGD